MIKERFLIAAVNIKRKYIKLMEELDFFEDRARITLDKLEETIKGFEKIQEEIVSSTPETRPDGKQALDRMLALITNIEDEGRSIEEFIKPINDSIDVLALEEKELFNQICTEHPNLSHSEIVRIVTERIEKEGLS
jgi:hypothetical protein